jgi:hypothetical protein
MGVKVKGAVYGKMSELFWFPAGDWSDKVHLNVAPRADGSVNADVVSAWCARKHKAVFSYDALKLSLNGVDSLFVVLKVFKVA